MSKEDLNEVDKLLSRLSSYLVAGLAPLDKITITRADHNQLTDLVVHGHMRSSSTEEGFRVLFAYQLSDSIQLARNRVAKRVRDSLTK